MSTERNNLVVGKLVANINALVAELDITYREYDAAKQWMIEVGEAGEWPLLLDIFFEHSIEAQATRSRPGSEGSILGPYHLPGSPLLEAPFELPCRPDEPGERLHITGSVRGANGAPLAGAELDVWQADAEGFYSSFSDVPEGNLRGRVRTDERGRFELRTFVPAAYTIPHAGPTGRLLEACGLHPWRPAHIHVLVSADGHEQLITQLYFADGEYLESDVADAVKDSLVVRPEPNGDCLHFEYNFELAPAQKPLAVG